MIINWTPNNSALSVSQQLEWKDNAVGIWNTSGVTPANPLPANASQAILSGLQPGKIYSVRIKMICTTGFTYSAEFQINIIMFCIGPKDFGLSSSTADSVTIAFPNSFNLPIPSDISKLKVRLYKQSDNSFIQAVEASISNRSVAQLFVFTGLTAGTVYYYTYQLCKTFGTEEICSAVNNCGGNAVDYQISTVAAGLNISYSYNNTDPYVNDSTLPIMDNVTLVPITNNAPIVFTLPSAAVGKFLIVKIPSGQSPKTAYSIGLNNGVIPDAVLRQPFTLSGHTYIVSRDGAGFAFDPLDAQLTLS